MSRIVNQLVSSGVVALVALVVVAGPAAAESAKPQVVSNVKATVPEYCVYGRNCSRSGWKLITVTDNLHSAQFALVQNRKEYRDVQVTNGRVDLEHRYDLGVKSFEVYRTPCKSWSLCGTAKLQADAERIAQKEKQSSFQVIVIAVL